MRKGNRGAANELMVCTDLLTRGAEVFRSVSQHASCDIIAIWPEEGGRLERIEVRAVGRRADGSLGANIFDRDRCDVYAFCNGAQIDYVAAENAPARYRYRRAHIRTLLAE